MTLRSLVFLFSELIKFRGEKSKTSLIEVTSPPILALPVWTEPFSLSTDASEIGAGAMLTQCIEGVENVIAYGSKRWS